MPKVSVIIPSYNGLSRGYLAACLTSVHKQTLQPIEVILVDDGSTDKTGDWVRAHFPNIQVLTKSNGGVSSARNLGIAAATGDLIAFLDDDDTWELNKLERQAATFAQSPSIGMAYCGMRLLDPEGREIYTQSPTGLGLTWPEILLSNHIFSPSTVMIRRELADQVGEFDTTLTIGEDYDYYIRCSKQAPIGIQSDLLVYYRCHPQQASASLRAIDCATLAVVKRHCQSLAQTKGRRIFGFVQAGAILRAFVRRDFAEGYSLLSQMNWRDSWLLLMRALGLVFIANRRTRTAWRQLETKVIVG